MVKLSIIMPAYNVQDWIGDAIESVLSAGSDGLEVLVIDDGSTDATSSITRSYASRFPEVVRYIRKANGHYGSAVNRGVTEARGAYIRIVDGDDLVNGAGIRDLLRLIDEFPTADLILEDYEEFYEWASEPTRFSLPLPVNTLMTIEDGAIPDFGMHAAVFRTSMLREHGIRLMEHVPFTDQEYVLYSVLYVRSYVYGGTVVYRYRIGREGQSVDPRMVEKTNPSHRLVLEKVLNWYDALDRGSIPPAVLEFIDYHVARFCCVHMRRSRGLPSVRKALEEVRWANGEITRRKSLLLRDIRPSQFKLFRLVAWHDFVLLSVYLRVLRLVHALRREV